MEKVKILFKSFRSPMFPGKWESYWQFFDPSARFEKAEYLQARYISDSKYGVNVRMILSDLHSKGFNELSEMDLKIPILIYFLTQRMVGQKECCLNNG